MGLTKIQSELIYLLKIFYDKIGTWQEVADIIGVSPRTLYRWRKGKVKSSNKDLKKIKRLLKKYTDSKYNKTDIYENEKVNVKYNLPEYIKKDYIKEQEGKKALITLRTSDFAYRDSRNRWRVGVFAHNVDSNYKGKRGQYIKYKQAKKLINKGKKHINLVNKARQFKIQKDLDYTESFSLARDWEKKYYQEKREYFELRDSLYYQKSGLRLGQEGAELLNMHYKTDKYGKGQYLSEENRQLLENMNDIPFGDLQEGLTMYIDDEFGLKPSL